MKHICLKSVLILIFWGIFSQSLTGQISNFKLYGMEDGLGQTLVKSIIQDKDGNIWVSTLAGVSRFDGRKFYNYDTQDGLASYNIISSFEDNNSNLYFGHGDGSITLFNFKEKTFKPLQIQHITQFKPVTCFAQDKEERIWIGTDGSGLICLDNSNTRIIQLTKEEGLISNSITSLLIYENDQIWCGTKNNGIVIGNITKILNLFNKDTSKTSSIYDTFTFINSTNFAITDEIKKLSSIRTEIWISTANSGIFRIEKNLINSSSSNDLVWQISGVLNKDNELPSNSINNFFEDVYGKIWIGFEDNGITRVAFTQNGSVSTEKLYEEKQGLPSVKIITLTDDYEGNIWIGTYIGMIKFNNDKFLNFNKESAGLSGSNVFEIYKDHGSNIWIGTHDGLNMLTQIKKDNQNSWIAVNDKIPEKMRVVKCFAVYQDKDDQFWFGTDNDGIYLYGKNKQLIKHFTNVNNVQITAVNSIIEDSNSKIWMGTSIGVITYDKKTNLLKHYTPADGLDTNRVQQIYIDRNYNIWFAYVGAPIIKFDGTDFHRYDISSGYESRATRGFTEDQEGNLWIGTFEKGLYKYNGKNFVNYTANEGLISNSVYTITSDKQGNIWTGTNLGLNKIDPKTMKIDFYGKLEGFMGIECNLNACCIDDDDNLWFGTIMGAVKYDPKQDKVNLNEPKTKITNLKIFDKEVNMVGSANFTYENNFVTFEYIGVSLINPQKVFYQYKLDGFDYEWSNKTNKTEVTYSFLPPGSYAFNVKACNNDGIWNKNPVTYSFTIHPPYWKTWWFRILFILISGGIIYWIYRQHISGLQNAKLLLEKTVVERTQELTEKNIELERLSIVANKTDNAVFITNSVGELEFTNEGFTRLFGYTYNEFVSKKGKHIFDLSENSDIKNILQNCKDTKKSIRYETLNTRNNGSKRWLQTTLTPVLNDENEIIKFVAIDSDITERKEAEEKISAQNDHITNSLKYAVNIQSAILPNDKELLTTFDDYFILYRPKDIVSGDFYWFNSIKSGKNEIKIIAVCDCTGHGVPGAFMSMIGNDLLNQIIIEKKILKADKILTALDEGIKFALKQSDDFKSARDGMDLGICIIDQQKQEIQFAGASRPLWYFKKSGLNKKTDFEFTEIKADIYSVGGQSSLTKKFTAHSFEFNKGDLIYMSSDGFADQFGGKDGKRLRKKAMIELISNRVNHELAEQRDFLEKDLIKWKGTHEQTDDILILGIKL